MNRDKHQEKVRWIIAKVKGFSFVKSIPVGLWIGNPEKVKEALKNAKKQL